jgi:hypothetical protein
MSVLLVFACGSGPSGNNYSFSKRYSCKSSAARTGHDYYYDFPGSSGEAQMLHSTLHARDSLKYQMV